MLALLILAAPAARAASPAAASLTAQDRADIQRIEQFLNGVHTMSARFEQYSETGGTAEGTVYLSRPGRMRFEYDQPSPILLVADGTFVVYIDNSLKQVTYLPIGSTPAWFLLREHVSLSDGVTVTRFERGSGAIRVTLAETKSPENGTLTLTFGDKPLELKQWAIVDQEGKTTTVALENARFGTPLDPKLFTFVDPRDPQHREH
ncbi:MAG: outer membrane lipoprotein carrier protein LolA [Alphaproteobacteria bacterium]|nr:outer membrane lipoprotein carrier protein LolA [Alphaproteobacteria bacterium]